MRRDVHEQRGGPIPMEWRSLISWATHYTCIPTWDAKQASACFPTAIAITRAI